jgi:ABC-type Mn2+/Zn2+ transport system permease subunit
MSELIRIYAWTLPAGAAFAAALAVLGAHLAARDRAMQTVCVSQGAILGVILALGLAGGIEHPESEDHFVPFLISSAVSALTYWVTQRLARARGSSKNTVFAAVFAILLASGYFASAIFPALESHMTQIYFGDLATLTEFDSKLTLFLGALCLAGYFGFWKPLTNQSFETSVFGELLSSPSERAWSLLFNCLALGMLCYSVQFLGFLLTISALFVPTTVLSYLRGQGALKHLLLVALTAGAGTLAGFLGSLRFTRFPTVPSIALATLAICLAIALPERALAAAFSRPKDP